MKIFIVYCFKDKKSLLLVKEIISSLGHVPIVLDELLPTGTIFDKLMNASKQCNRAIVIYSGNDCGGPFKKEKNKIVLKRRARENVVFELGLFIGQLTIKNVLILLNKNIDRTTLPSDLSGIETKSLNVKKDTLKKNIKQFLERPFYEKDGM